MVEVVFISNSIIIIVPGEEAVVIFVEAETTTFFTTLPTSLFCKTDRAYMADSIKAALGIEKLLSGGHSRKPCHCSICSNVQLPRPITKATFFDLAVFRVWRLFSDT